jgi:hypothetical protein
MKAMWGHRGQVEMIAQRALQKYAPELMEYPNVIGLGLARARKDRSGDELYVVKIYVSKRPSFFQRHIPSNLRLALSEDPSQVITVPTEIEEIGQIELETG